MTVSTYSNIYKFYLQAHFYKHTSTKVHQRICT